MPQLIRLCILATLCSSVLAQVSAPAPPLSALEATWRATSRLGYGPDPASAQAAQSDPKAWALQQVGAAFAASQTPAKVSAELSAFNAPVESLAASYNAEREARKQIKEAVALTPLSQIPGQTPGQTPAVQTPEPSNPNTFTRDATRSAAAWRLLACSDPSTEQPLLARMTEFWFNHLNVSATKGTVRHFVGHYAVNAIRPHALGKFEDLLLASAQHPAMLLYLDQAQSNVRGINENYARELMELHTLGVNAGYSQSDVRELARVLTGWTARINRGEGYSFAPGAHDGGSKTVLGQTFGPSTGAAGEQEGIAAIRMLARHPATAQRIATRLASTFVADKPSAALVVQLAATFTQTQGDIRAVMTALVSSPEFWRADNALLKTPLDFACSALIVPRAQQSPEAAQQRARDAAFTLGFLAQAGQPMHQWPTPDGYKTDAATWLAPEAMTRRADFALTLARRSRLQAADTAYLLPFFKPTTNARISAQPLPDQAGLALASPDFMRK